MNNQSCTISIFLFIFQLTSSVFGAVDSNYLNQQYNNFMRDPMVVALMTQASLDETIQKVISEFPHDKQIKQKLEMADSSRHQMILWMQNLSQLIVKDYSSSEWNSFDNIKYVWTWAYIKNDQLILEKDEENVDYYSLIKMIGTQINLPKRIANLNPIPLQKIMLGDNNTENLDQNNNPMRKFRILENLRHFNSDYYKEIQVIASDFRNKGTFFHFLETTHNLHHPRISFIEYTSNFIDAAKILKNSCIQGTLHFDLDLKTFMINKGNFVEEKVDCDGQ